MFFGSGYRIQEIKNTLEELTETQRNSVRNLRAEIEKIDNEASAQIRMAREHISDMVILGDDANYAQLGVLIREAGASYNFPELIAQWREEDKDNRAEHESLVQQHGTQSEVRQRIAGLKADISIVTEALSEMNPEIEAFDEATDKIAAHNQKYPKLEISEGMHDNYENWNFLRWLGYYTFIYRAPHSAYLAIGDYTKQYGDYYEDARDVSKLRANAAAREGELAELNTKHDAESAIDDRMSTLNRLFRGPGGIAGEIRQRIYDFMRTDDDYADILYDKSGNDAAKSAALCLAKADALKALKETMTPFLNNARETARDLDQPMNTLNRVPYAVQNDRVSFDLDTLVSDVRNASRQTRDVEHSAQAARIDMDEFKPSRQQDYASIKRDLAGQAQRGYFDNHLSLNFVSLERAVRRAVDEYEEEQRRIREAERRAEEARREALRESFEAAAKVRARRERSASTRMSQSSIGGGRTRTRTTSVSAGTSGISGSRRRR